MEQDPQGFNGVSIAERTVRHLGIEVANAQITLATQNARLEEIAEAASFINFDLWDAEEVHEVDLSHEGNAMPVPPPPAQRFSVPAYQVEVVVRLLQALQPR